ncbi:hypothetical protein D5018_19580 [Parashewanella curva]|uniref:Uncharacterized protein n=1 Tax=Parashewanella curva TaxID=2338552 RepID=A0A3L8PRZ2_9GAMM|nr:hypothetical protein [Parashewanella curva]RLV58004.1 hypothetical protein D5018_19580 [Parashewanella curva]
MIKKIARFIWNLSAVCFLIILGFQGIKYVFKSTDLQILPELCQNTDVAEYPSPDGTKIAELGYVDCGATTNWETGVNIVDVKTGKVYRGMFGLDGKPEKLKVTWQSNRKLLISNFPAERLIRLRQDNFSGVSIKIKPM